MKKMKTSEGTMSANPPANRNGSGESPSELNTWAGNVRLDTVRIVAANTSFQDSTKVKIPAAANPGSASGRATRKKAPIGLQPRVSAASSRSLGTDTKMLLVISTVVGNASAVCTSATA